MIYIIEINRNNGIPIYVQVKSQILGMIKNGTLKVGDKMHTERELSEMLKVSRNTVSMAYRELENIGVLKSYQGKGTFVAEENITWKADSIREKIIKFVDLGFEEALETGMNAEEFLQIVNVRVKEKQEMIKKMLGVYIECNTEQAKMFGKNLSQGISMNIKSLTIPEIQAMDKNTRKTIEDAQVLITTFNHVNEVTSLTNGFNKEVLGVAINADLGTIVKIARYPEYTRFALFCISEEFEFKIQGALESAGLSNIDIIYSNTVKKDEIIKIINNVDKIIVSPGRFKDIESLNRENKEIIEFLYTLDEGSVNALKSKLLEMKNHN